MKTVLKTLKTDYCRTREISENEKSTFSNYTHLQRYHPALDIFKVSDSVLSHKNLELPSTYFIDSWISNDDTRPKIWNTLRTCNNTIEPCKTFVKCIHLLSPIDIIKEKYTCPEHPLLPQSEKTWKNTLLKLHSHNNQAYVDTVANFVLSRFRELDLTPHCILYYGALTGISKCYQFNISNEYDTYKQCRWFWKGMKSHSARLTIISDNTDTPLPNFEEIYKEITTCPFDDNESDSNLEDILDINISDVDSIRSITFDNIEDDANIKDIFEINKQLQCNSLKNNKSVFKEETDSEETDNEENDSSSESTELDLNICIEIPNMPIILIQQEAQEGVMDNLLDDDEIDGHKRGSQGWEARWIAWLFQIIAVLSFLQNAICFTHNDLHTNNILWKKTDKKFLYYTVKDGTIWRVPTFGKIFSIIDFGRAIFRLGNHLWISDDHWPDQDAGDQYNFGPFFDHAKPKNQPNPSFDLCRLSISLIDGLFDKAPPKKKGKNVSIMSEEDSWKVYETTSHLYNILWCWTINKYGHTVYETKNGEEKYEGFDLYIRIAHDVQNAVPKDQIHKPIFQQFKWPHKVAQSETIYSLGT